MKINDALTGLFFVALLALMWWPDADKKEIQELEKMKLRKEIQLKKIELYQLGVDTVEITNKSNL